MKKLFILLCAVASTHNLSFTWGPTLSLSKETITVIDNMKLSIDQFPAHIGQELNNIITASQAAANITIAQTYNQIKALPVIGLGCTGTFYALWLLHHNIQKLHEHPSDAQQNKRYAYYAAASAALFALSLIAIAKSDAIIATLAGL